MKKIVLTILLICVAVRHCEALPRFAMHETDGQEKSDQAKGNGEQELIEALKNEGLPDDFITESIEQIKYGGLGDLIDTSSLRSTESDYTVKLVIDRTANPTERYKGLIVSAPSTLDVLVNGLRMRLPVKLESLSDIAYDDFVVYTMLENLKTDVSIPGPSPEIKVTNKLEKTKKYPDPTTMLERFSNLKSKLPADHRLDNVYFDSSIKKTWKEEHTIEEWIKIIGEQKFKKQWEDFLKHYKINRK